MRFRHGLGFLLLVLAIVLPTFGQMRSGARASLNIDGNVRDEASSEPMQNIRVDLKQSAGIPVNSTFTSASGDFQFAGLSSGSYVVEIDVKGYEPARQSVDLRSETRYSVSISMTRSAIVVNTTSNLTISAHQLSVPRKARDEYDKGFDLLYRKSDSHGAIEQFERAIKDFATYYEAYAEIGNAYLRLKELPSAEEAFRKSVELSSGHHSPALIMLAGLLNDMSRFQDAVTFARKAMEVDSSSWYAPFQLARALSGLNRIEEAEKSALQARDLNPSNPPVYLMLANIFIHRHEYPALITDLDAYLKLEPFGPDADQARKLRQDVQDYMEDSKGQADSQDADQPANNDGQGPANGTALATPQKGRGAAVEPDSSGLPSLPPPAENIP